jgi:hypothetical protein
MRSENIAPIFIFSGIFDQSFASEIPPSTRKSECARDPLSQVST